MLRDKKNIKKTKISSLISRASCKRESIQKPIIVIQHDMCHNGAMEQGVMGAHKKKYGHWEAGVMTLKLVPEDMWKAARQERM